MVRLGLFLSLKGPGGACFVLLCHARMPIGIRNFERVRGAKYEANTSHVALADPNFFQEIFFCVHASRWHIQTKKLGLRISLGSNRSNHAGYSSKFVACKRGVN